MTGPKILLCAVEPSADQIGAALMAEIRSRAPEATFLGCGGPAMGAQGLNTAFDTNAFAVMGLWDALKVVPLAMRRARELAELAATHEADIAVLIDAWSFSRLVAKQLKRRAPKTKIVKLAAPQVWASRPHRVDFVKEHFNLTLTLLPFEPPYFEAVGAPASFIGNPNFAGAQEAGPDPVAFRKRHGLSATEPVLLLLPGSRSAEVKRLLPVYGQTVASLRNSIPGLETVVVAAPRVEQRLREAPIDWEVPPVIVGTDERFDAFGSATAALAASGTVTTELAIIGTPMVVTYKVDPLTAWWARRILITDYVTILNVAAGEEIIPERLQDQATPETLAPLLHRLLVDAAAREAQLAALRPVLSSILGQGDPSANAATEILRLV